MDTAVLVEQVGLLEAQLDESTRTIKNVRLIKAGMSLNRRFYSQEVLRASASLFEGVKAYADHENWFGGRSVRDITGWFTNAEYREDGIYATRHFTDNSSGEDSYKMAKTIMAGNAPKTLYGLSINAVGKTKTMRQYDDSGDADVVEAITSVFSVDDVTTPAAGGAFLVAGTQATLSGELLKHISLEELESSRPDLVSKLKKRWQAVRQTEALAASREALDEALASVAALEEQNAALSKELAGLGGAAQLAETKLKVAEVLRAARLPKAFEEDLSKRLPGIAQEEWPAIVEAERRKAAATKNSVPIPPLEALVPTAKPALRRPSYESVQTPEQHQAYLKQIQDRSQ